MARAVLGAAASVYAPWTIGWGEDTVCAIYPEGSSAGLTAEAKAAAVLAQENPNFEWMESRG